MGAVLGWPTLDHPVVPGGEGLAWNNRPDGVEFRALGVTIPRLDDMRKVTYNTSIARYTASKGQLMSIDDVTGEHVRLISEEEARVMRAALMMANQVPFAQMEPIELDAFCLNPGERVVVPVRWNRMGTEKVTTCSTHPEAPADLVVLPGVCDAKD